MKKFALLGCGGLILILAAVAVVGGIFIAGAYNGLVKQEEGVKTAWSQVENVYQRRADLIPNLVETVKGYAGHEREVFEHVAEARSRAAGTQGVADRAGAENQVTAGLRQLFAVVENYPDLKANTNFLALQEELSATESKIAYARQFYNDQVMRLNTSTQSFPSNLLAKAFGFREREFFEIEDTARGPVDVDLGGS